VEAPRVSGRRAERLVSTAISDATCTINVTKNGLDPSTFTPAAFEAVLRRVFGLVPGLNASSLTRIPSGQCAFEHVGRELMPNLGGSAEAQLKAALHEFGHRVQELGGAVGHFAEED